MLAPGSSADQAPGGGDAGRTAVAGAPVTAPRYVLGLDGGGTHCRARLCGLDGRTLGEGEGGPANLLVGSGRVAADSIAAAARAAAAAAGLAPAALAETVAGLGVAGATAAGRAGLLDRPLPFARVVVLSDSHAAALGAHGGADGGVAIVGTGAVACVVSGGRVREIGGWGFAADDLGSGADIGRRAARAALRAVDAAGADAPPEGALARAVFARFDGAEALCDWSMAATPGAFGGLAPLVFEAAAAGDEAAAAILADAAAELDRLVRLAARHGAARVALLGAVATRLAPRLSAEAMALLTPPLADAAAGAALAARRALGAEIAP